VAILPNISAQFRLDRINPERDDAREREKQAIHGAEESFA
jgi:hypothetical protein